MMINRSYLQALILVCFPAGAGFALVSLLCCAVFVAGLLAPSCTPGYLRGGPTWLDACFTACLWAFVWPGCSVDFVTWPPGGTIGWPLTEGPWVWPPWTCRKRIVSPEIPYCFFELNTALDQAVSFWYHELYQALLVKEISDFGVSPVFCES